SEHSLWLPRFWDSLNFKKDREFVGITVLFLDEKINVVGQIRSVQGSGLTKETTRVVIRLLINPLWLPRFWDSLNFKKDREFVGITILFLDEKINVVGQIRSVQGSGLTKETTRVVIRLLINP
ncbi:hypothetical protein HID58_085401, partial [Brassica napus]